MKYIEETSHTCNRTRKEQLDQQDKANPGKENTGPEWITKFLSQALYPSPHWYVLHPSFIFFVFVLATKTLNQFWHVKPGILSISSFYMQYQKVPSIMSIFNLVLVLKVSWRFEIISGSSISTSLDFRSIAYPHPTELVSCIIIWPFTLQGNLVFPTHGHFSLTLHPLFKVLLTSTTVYSAYT